MQKDFQEFYHLCKKSKFIMQQIFILILCGVGGALSTFILQKYGLSAVVASCLIGLLGAYLGHLTRIDDIALVVFAGSFVGMTSTLIGTVPMMLVGGAITGLIYVLTTHIFAGFGGRLGTIAFVSTVISFYLLMAIKNLLRKMN